jgi:hypothetical protein
MHQLCHGIVKKNNSRCTFPAKHFMPDGTAYCGRHVPLIVSEPLPDTKLKEFEETNTHARKVLSVLFLFVIGLVTRMFHVIILIIILVVSHLIAKSYYFHNCESNLIKAWFFKKSTTCIGLSSFLNAVENLTFDGISLIAKYCMMTLGDLRFIFSN